MIETVPVFCLTDMNYPCFFLVYSKIQIKIILISKSFTAWHHSKSNIWPRSKQTPLLSNVSLRHYLRSSGASLAGIVWAVLPKVFVPGLDISGHAGHFRTLPGSPIGTTWRWMKQETQDQILRSRKSVPSHRPKLYQKHNTINHSSTFGHMNHDVFRPGRRRDRRRWRKKKKKTTIAQVWMQIMCVLASTLNGATVKKTWSGLQHHAQWTLGLGQADHSIFFYVDVGKTWAREDCCKICGWMGMHYQDQQPKKTSLVFQRPNWRPMATMNVMQLRFSLSWISCASVLLWTHCNIILL